MSDTVGSEIAADKATTQAATEGPWYATHEDQCCKGCCITDGRGVGPIHNIDIGYHDRSFIVAARNRWPLYIAAIEAVLELHIPCGGKECHDGDTGFCHSCDYYYWPCPTVRALAVLAPNKEQQ